MRTAPLRHDEAATLAALQDLQVLDSAAEAEFDALVRAASLICGTPIALISLVDADRQWFKANLGLPGVTETPRDQAFCAHAVLADDLFEVPDATKDPRFADNPLVAGAPDIRFYAGAPLRLAQGHRVGTLCVIDRQPRRLSPTQRELLQTLAHAASKALECRRSARQLQGALEQAERLALVARRTSNAVVITDTEGRVTWVNEGFERVTGYSAAEAIGHSPGRLLQCERTDRATVARIGKALAARQPFEGLLLNRSKTGHDYWIELEIQPIHDRSGQHTGFMAIESDVSTRVLAEQSLHAANIFLDTAGRIGGVGGWTLDPRTGAMEWTAQTCRILDRKPGFDHRVKDLLAHWTPQSFAIVKAAMDEGLDNTQTWDVELEMITATGRPILVHVAAEGEFNDDGPVRITGAIQDITARRALEDEVQRGAKLLRGAIDTIGEAFVLFDPQDRLVLCNERYRELYAHSADVIQPGNTFEHIIRTGAERGQYPAAMGRVDAWVAERMAAHQADSEEHVQHVAGGKVLRIVEHRMPDGHTVGFRIDVTSLVRATEAAERANEAKADFIGTMSHELRTPLQSIIGFSELGMHFASQQEQLKGMFKRIFDGGHRMLTLVNALLDISKIDGREGSLELSRGDLAGLTAAVAAELQPQSGKSGVTICLPQPLPELPVMVDAFRMQQVLRNVLSNALKFSPAGTAVTVAFADLGAAGVELTVSDQGPGIPPDELETVFDPFVQSTRTNDGSGGTGLGLTISRRIVRAHGGRIEARHAPGGGTLIHLWLPAAQRPPSVVPQHPTAARLAA